MIAGSTLAAPTQPALVVDPVDYLLVDLATGRHLPGDAVHVEQLAHEHGLEPGAAALAIDEAWRLGFLSRLPGGTSGLVCWTPETSQLQLHRLARAMVAAVGNSCREGTEHIDVIDGEQRRIGAVELFGLNVPSDVELFLELARALLARVAPLLVDELVVPIGILFSEAATTVHGLELAAPPAVRQILVCDLVRSLMDGRVEEFADTVADYVVALSVD